MIKHVKVFSLILLCLAKLSSNSRLDAPGSTEELALPLDLATSLQMTQKVHVSLTRLNVIDHVRVKVIVRNIKSIDFHCGSEAHTATGAVTPADAAAPSRPLLYSIFKSIQVRCGLLAYNSRGYMRTNT